MGTLIFTTQGFVLGAAAASTTLTHGLGVVPDFVTVMPALGGASAGAAIVASTSQIVVLVALTGMGAMSCNVKVEKFHSIIA
jgi:hypothetical protein